MGDISQGKRGLKHGYNLYSRKNTPLSTTHNVNYYTKNVIDGYVNGLCIDANKYYYAFNNKNNSKLVFSFGVQFSARNNKRISKYKYLI